MFRRRMLLARLLVLASTGRGRSGQVGVIRSHVLFLRLAVIVPHLPACSLVTACATLAATSVDCVCAVCDILSAYRTAL